MQRNLGLISEQETYIFKMYCDEYKKKYRFDVGFFFDAALDHNKQGKITYKGVETSFQVLQKKVVSIQKILIENYVQKGDRVLIFVQNSLAFYGIFYATLQSGAIAVPVNTFLSDAEFVHVVQDSTPRLVITLHQEYQRIFEICKMNNLHVSVLTFDEALVDVMVAEHKECIVQRDENDIAVVLYTSGTTGVPKGVMLSSKNIITNMLQTYTRIFSNFPEKQHTLIAALPLFHSFSQNTCVFTAIYCGVHIVLLSKIERHLLLDALKKYQPTVFLGVPALYGLLCLLKNASLESVEIFISGGDALPNKIRQAFSLIYNRKICNGYGLSEASPVVATDLSDTINEIGCIGKLFPGMQCEIRDELGIALSFGEIGNLYVRGDNVMLGYYNDIALTDLVLQNGWLNTGDRAYMNTMGNVIMVGREKELIKHKGFNIYPQEIENVILMDLAVVRAAVIAQRENYNGEEYPVAYVQIRGEYADEIERIKERVMLLCKERLAMYKIPRKFICTTQALPTTVTGKVDKKNVAKVIKS